MQVELHAGVFAYCSVPHGTDLQGVDVVATVRESEGLTLIVPEREAQRLGFAVLMRAAWLTLVVPTDLHAVGITARLSALLAAANISCNVVAGAYHDHLFVPAAAAHAALELLEAAA